MSTPQSTGVASTNGVASTTASTGVMLLSAAPPPATSESGPQAPQHDDYTTWYPPLRRTLLVLAKLYTSIELRAFSGLGQDALAMCTQSIQRAAKQVRSSALPSDDVVYPVYFCPFCCRVKPVPIEDWDYSARRIFCESRWVLSVKVNFLGC